VSSFRTILVVNIESEQGASALRRAVDLALDQRARLVVLTVIPPGLTHPTDASSAAVAADIARGFLRHHQASVSSIPSELGVESRVAYGSPRRKILEACVSCDCDLLVIPEPGRRGLLDRLLTPSLLRVARVSKVPVLVIGIDLADTACGSGRNPSGLTITGRRKRSGSTIPSASADTALP
jgi:nucleotide-binding universal stress UspA family protein